MFAHPYLLRLHLTVPLVTRIWSIWSYHALSGMSKTDFVYQVAVCWYSGSGDPDQNPLSSLDVGGTLLRVEETASQNFVYDGDATVFALEDLRKDAVVR